jgi:uncharacterized protein (TIGR03084 family)
MKTSLRAVCSDHRDEINVLAEMLETLTPHQWALATPAPDWTIADQVAHLAMFDERALWAISDPARFVADRTQLMAGHHYIEVHREWATTAPSELLSRWHSGAVALNDVARDVDPATRCEWYGPSMSVTSKMTARIMETWAHSHDVADALQLPVSFSQRLRHVAHIGVRSRKFAFAAHSLEAPVSEPYVELQASGSELWTWGDPNAPDVVRGSALGFCQLVTQRRHLDDTGVTAAGDGAIAWLKIAQAFAGPPGKGRVAGQFTAAT